MRTHYKAKLWKIPPHRSRNQPSAVFCLSMRTRNMAKRAKSLPHRSQNRPRGAIWVSMRTTSSREGGANASRRYLNMKTAPASSPLHSNRCAFWGCFAHGDVIWANRCAFLGVFCTRSTTNQPSVCVRVLFCTPMYQERPYNRAVGWGMARPTAGRCRQ